MNGAVVGRTAGLLALVILGAACYFGYWLSRLVSTQRDTLGAMLGGADSISVEDLAPG